MFGKTPHRSSLTQTQPVKTKVITWGITAVITMVLIALFVWTASTYNRLLDLNAQVKTAWRQLDTAYALRLELLPDLIKMIGGAKTSPLISEEVTALRVATRKSTAQRQSHTLREYDVVQRDIDSRLSRIWKILQNDAKLLSDQRLQSAKRKLEEIDARISVERRRMAQISSSYNNAMKIKTASLIARVFGFEPFQYSLTS